MKIPRRCFFPLPRFCSIRALVVGGLWLAMTGGLWAVDAQPAPSSADVTPLVTAVEGEIEADDIILVRVDHLGDWAAGHDVMKLIPFINGRGILGCYPVEVHRTKNHVRFHLHITTANRPVWIDLLGAPDGLRKRVTLSVGPENGEPFDTKLADQNRPSLTVISPVYGWIALAEIVGMFAIFLQLARKTNIIREAGPPPASGKLKPYNLGRTQMAFWFFLTQTSYLAIWLLTNDLDTITPALLGLMGISAGTALSEAMIDSNRDTTDATQLQELTAEKQSLEQSVAELQGQFGGLTALASPTPEQVVQRDTAGSQLATARLRLNQVNLQLKQLTPPPCDNVSRGFLKDILADEGGYSFHRFQIFAWTIVLGIVFVSSVYNNLTMPEFSATLLGLMGISSGTYIGFKFPSQK